MAFLNRFGSLCRQNLSQNIVSSGQAQLPSMLNAIRHMSGPNLFVGGLSFGTDKECLKEAFSGFGDVMDARIVIDRDTGYSKGFGFVMFSSDESASAALAMNGQELNGRIIRVNYAHDSLPAPQPNYAHDSLPARQRFSGYGAGGSGGGGSGYGRGAR